LQEIWNHLSICSTRATGRLHWRAWIIAGLLRGRGQHQPVFRDNDIDSAVSPSLTTEDLKDLGIASVGHRRRLLEAIAAPSRPGKAFDVSDLLRDISAPLANLVAQNWPIYLGPREVWRRIGDRESGQQEVFVQDPDGYLLMLAQNIGHRVLANPRRSKPSTPQR
jgi:SAM (Sterile alpha motif) domain-containing protein